jgi:hypothetical protein
VRRLASTSFLLLLALIAAGPGGFGACADRLEELRRMIEQEIGVPHARDASQCKLIAFGSKPCGGPWRYLVYSTATTNESTLAQLVSEFNQIQQTINEERRTVSDCAVTPKPRLELVDGVCRANRQ